MIRHQRTAMLKQILHCKDFLKIQKEIPKRIFKQTQKYKREKSSSPSG